MPELLWQTNATGTLIQIQQVKMSWPEGESRPASQRPGHWLPPEQSHCRLEGNVRPIGPAIPPAQPPAAVRWSNGSVAEGPA
ncbi:MAG: hypothetical protein R3D55_01255 [Chloroflexota bacterium]